jgi:predicted ArsR family transcriptional regulator
MLNQISKKEYITPIQYNIIKKLEEKGAMIRKDLVKELNTARTTIYDNLIKLKKRKVVEKYVKYEGKRGRPVVLWKLTEGDGN